MAKIEWDPGKILEISGSYWRTCALHAGVKLDLFTIIGDGRLDAGQVAEKIGGDRDGVERLLNALTAMEFLVKKDGLFENTQGARAFLNRKSPGYTGFMIMHHHHLLESWGRLDESVLSGEPIRQRMSFSDDEWRENFLMGMFNMASNLAPRLAPEIDLAGRATLLDLGGGPGTYAIHFCLYNQDLKATVYDLPTTKPFAEKTIEKFGLSDRISFQEGDYTRESIRGEFDAAWLSHVLHGEDPETCREIVKKAVSALNPGGLIVIHDFILNDSMDGPLFPALFSLNMLLGTDGGQSYSESQISDMLSEAGVRNVERIYVQTPNDSGIIVGTVD